jgi:type II secretory pathway pseudopilin PulG
VQAKRDKGGSVSEQGFMLLGLIVAIFLILLALSAAAPQIGRSLRRDRDVEAVHRGNQYVRGIREYYVKFQHYPGTLEQLEKTNNIRFLRQRYKDPINGKEDWRLIPVGQNKTTVKGFFGQPLAGLPTAGLGSAAGMASPGIGQTPTGFGGSTGTTGASGATGSTGASGSTNSSLQGIFGSTPGGFGAGGSGSVGPFMGVGLSATGDSVVEVNQQTTYPTWEFLYDPRVELLKAQAAAGAAAGSIGAGSLGQTPGSIGNPTAPGATGATPFGSTTPAPAPPAPPTIGAPIQPPY